MNDRPDPIEKDAQTRIEWEEFARGHVPEGTPPPEPRPAATIVVARPSPPSFQVLLLERSHALRFAAGAFVFPGGVVDTDDADPRWARRIPLTEEPAACVGAIRELFEETGILPGHTSVDADLAEARFALLRDERAFSQIAREHGLDFSREPIAYFARWITPRTLSRRYDTRFFLLEVAEETGGLALTSEHESARWAHPEAALEACATGSAPMLLPTRRTLERLASFRTLEEAFETLVATRVEPWLAKLRVTPDGIHPLMPGDPGYEDAY